MKLSTYYKRLGHVPTFSLMKKGLKDTRDEIQERMLAKFQPFP